MIAARAPANARRIAVFLSISSLGIYSVGTSGELSGLSRRRGPAHSTHSSGLVARFHEVSGIAQEWNVPALDAVDAQPAHVCQRRDISLCALTELGRHHERCE